MRPSQREGFPAYGSVARASRRIISKIAGIPPHRQVVATWSRLARAGDGRVLQLPREDDLAHRPQRQREVVHEGDVDVLPEPKREITVALGIENGEGSFQMDLRIGEIALETSRSGLASGAPPLLRR